MGDKHKWWGGWVCGWVGKWPRCTRETRGEEKKLVKNGRSTIVNPRPAAAADATGDEVKKSAAALES